MEKAKLMQLEIEKKRRLPKRVKDSINTNIFENLLAAVIIMAYLCAINITYYNVNDSTFEECMKYFALGIIVVTVISFEISYRKNSVKFAFISIELLLCAILSLYIPYIYIHTTDYLRYSIMILPAILIVYYAIKSLIIFKQEQFQYRNNLSDVKEIVKDSENTSYIDEDSRKIYKEKTVQEEVIRKEIIKNQDLRKKNRLKRKQGKEV